MVLRMSKLDDLEGILDLLDSCFRTEREYFEVFVPDGTSFPHLSIVAEEGGEIIGHLQIYPRRVRTISGEALAGGVGNVAVRRDFRRRGIASSMLQEATRIMGDIGVDFSILFASKVEFYRKNGWEVLPTTVHRFNLEDRAKESMEIEEVGGECPGWVKALSDRFNDRFTMTVIRNDYLWRLQLSYKKRKLVVSRKKGAYLVYSKLEDGSILIEDCAYEDEDEFLEILRGLGGVFVFKSLIDHPVYRLLRKHSVSAETKPLIEVFVKPIRMGWDEMVRELGIDRDCWHFWNFDYF